MSDVFVTLFDSHFLHHGLALHRSLLRVQPTARLLVIAMDTPCLERLRNLRLPGLLTVAVENLLDDELRRVRSKRSRGEFCWTLSPVAVEAGLHEAGPGGRSIYVDADLWFLDSPMRMLDQMDDSGALALLTEHGFAPGQAAGEIERHGRFCVQFVAVRDHPATRAALSWWRQRCTEWCHDRVEPGRFGDQKYLDAWPGMLGNQVLVPPPTMIGGPWNLAWLERTMPGFAPLAMHFHGWRAVAGGWRCWRGYPIPHRHRATYRAYQTELETLIAGPIGGCDGGWRPPLSRDQLDTAGWLKRLARRAIGTELVSPLGNRDLATLFEAT